VGGTPSFPVKTGACVARIILSSGSTTFILDFLSTKEYLEKIAVQSPLIESAIDIVDGFSSSD
jgi:hypothetical protein